MHAATGKLVALIANIRAAFIHIKAAVAQLTKTDRWQTFLD